MNNEFFIQKLHFLYIYVFLIFFKLDHLLISTYIIFKKRSNRKYKNCNLLPSFKNIQI